MLLDLLKSNNIEYQIENIAPSVDITFTGGGEGLQDIIAIKLKSEDFSKVDNLLNDIAIKSLDLIGKDHYLYNFTNDELLEILENYDEWNRSDFALAKKILKDRGKEIAEDKVQELIDKKNAELRKPEKGNKAWLIFGYISAILGGFLGIFIGYYHFSFKKSLPTGEKIYVYDAETRKTGLQIFYIGIVSFVIWIVLKLMEVY
jgi:hypothetical protein